MQGDFARAIATFDLCLRQRHAKALYRASRLVLQSGGLPGSEIAYTHTLHEGSLAGGPRPSAARG